MRIDLNADVGESYGQFTIGEDDALFESITSANIACGLHAGDFNVMRKTVEKASRKNVSIGAHPGYPDIQGFGRRDMAMPPREVYNAVVYQIGALKQFCAIQGVPISHVKPHGALYNTAAVDVGIADAIAEAVYDTLPDAYLYGLCNSELMEAGKRIGLKTAGEAFADRRYTAEGTLCSRLLSNAVLRTYEEIEKQVKDIVLKKQVRSVTGELISLQADTICFHGDGEGVAHNASTIRRALEEAGVRFSALGGLT
ncbi:LamB/YcsF family protein [Sporosarcina sp. G11-34]|uniref:LamB/YcsF family protein n=1 Tax=Sporosarcina sp. G11-34 TaxID=2849605 RepID=UPI0022A9EC43|nr:5-oxoprolinase subunit PxpA [Sporosarcina sp. G11-34]MCZ2260534.1 LamB/YcsF family protein [Sporosarcina sp. G11-34]